MSQDPHAQVYLSHGGLYGCLRRDGRRYRLGPGGEPRAYCYTPAKPCNESTFEVLAGTMVAWTEGFFSQRILVRDLASGQLIHKLEIRVVDPRAGEAQEHRMALKSDGSIAWFQEENQSPGLGPPGCPGCEPSAGSPPALPLPVYSIFVVDRNGFRTLGTSLPTVPQDFRLTGSKLTWSQETTEHSATVN